MKRLEPLFAMVLLMGVLAPISALAATTYYVATTGSDSNVGTEAAPFATWAKAQTTAAAGDTVYFRGGRYVYTTATSTCGGNTAATVSAVVLSKSGTSGNPINYFAYPGEKPVFDFSGLTDTANYNCRQTGVRVTGSWLHLKGLEFTGVLQLNNLNHESWCVYVNGGSNNLFEMLDAHHNMGPGFFLQHGSNNTFLNCDSHENEDTLTSNGDGQSADGFGCHPQTGDTGNVFRGCRAWWNTDDGWDFIHANEVCAVEYCWSWYHGYKPDVITGGQPVSLSAGNGNGFKAGGYDMPPSNVPANIPQHIVRFNVSFYNKASGVVANYSPVSPIFYNNTSFMNHPDYNMLGVASDGTASISVGFLRNNLAFGGTLTSSMTLTGPIDDQYNSWDSSMGITLTNADFESVAFAPPASCPAPYSPGGTVCVPPTDTTSFAGMASARQADGSLPILPFLRLAAGSKAIDKGTTTGLPQPYPAYAGAAPDLGAFERDATGSGGAPSTGGASSAGTTSGTGGAGTGGATSGVGGAGTGGRTGGGAATGGTIGMQTGGATGTVGTGGSSGGNAGAPSSGAGGTSTNAGSSAGGSATGGAPAGTGGVGTGGAETGGAGNGGTTSSAQGGLGGTSSSLGSSGSGGVSATSAQTTNSAAAGATGSSASGTAQEGGCGCRVGDRSASHRSLGLILLGLIALRRGRRQARVPFKPPVDIAT